MRQYLNVSVGKKILDQGPIHPGHTSMMDSESVRQQITQLAIFHLYKDFTLSIMGLKISLKICLIIIHYFD